MIKAKDFWNYLCNELDYRFFAGVPCKGFKSLYDKMNPEFMHYIPAVNEQVALGMASGANLAGIKSGILIDFDNIYVVCNWLFNFNMVYKVPLLIIAYKEFDKKIQLHGLTKSELYDNKFENKLKQLTTKLEKSESPGLLIIGKGVIT